MAFQSVPKFTGVACTANYTHRELCPKLTRVLSSEAGSAARDFIFTLIPYVSFEFCPKDINYFTDEYFCVENLS